MNISKQNIGLFIIVTEDGLPGFQHNYHYNDDADGLGEWGKGGTLGQEYVVYTHNDVHVHRLVHTMAQLATFRQPLPATRLTLPTLNLPNQQSMRFTTAM